MSDLGHHFRNVHLQNLVDQNQELRRRIAKLTQIEGYVELLVDKLEKAQIKEKTLSNENAIMRQQVRELEGKFANSENMHGDQMRYVFGQHDQLVEEKNHTIIQLKNALEKEGSRAGQLEAQFRFQKSNQQQIVSQYEEALIKYRNRVSELQQDLQIVYKSLEEEKYHHSNTKDTWITEANQLKQALQERDMNCSKLRDEVQVLKGTNQKLQLETNVLMDFNQKLEDKLVLTEEEMTQTIMRLRDDQQDLNIKLSQKETQCKNEQMNNNSLSKEVEELRIIQSGLKNDNETYITDNQRLIFLLEESDKENTHLRERHRELEDYSSAQVEQLKLESLRLREENNVLNKNNGQRETYLGTKLIELKEANSAKDSLRVYLDQSQGELSALRVDFEDVQTSLLSQKKYSTQIQIDKKNYAEAANRLKHENLNLQQMLKRLQRENLQLSTQNHNLARVLGNPRQQNREYVEQMDKIVKNFHVEREDQNKRHSMQKQKLKEMYEYDFRQKEMELMRQIGALQDELSRSARLQVLVQRQKNRPTPAKTQYRTPLKQ